MGVASSHTDNVENYSVVEDATPFDPSGTSGGVGMVSASADTRDTLIRVERQNERTNLARNARCNLWGHWDYYSDVALFTPPWDMSIHEDPSVPSGFRTDATISGVTAGAPALSTRETDGVLPVPLEVEHTASVYVKVSPNLVGANITMQAETYLFGSGWGNTGTNTAVVASGNWQRINVVFTLSAGTTFSHVTVYVNGSEAIGDVISVSSLLIEEGNTVLPWFSGADLFGSMRDNLALNGDFADSNGTTTVRTNTAKNPFAWSSGSMAEYNQRWSWTRSFSASGGPGGLGPTSYCRMTVGGGSVGTGRGIDLYGNADVGTPGTTGDAILQPVSAGQQYTVSAWVRLSATGTARFRYRIHNGAGTWLTAITDGPTFNPTVNTWTRISYTFTAGFNGYVYLRAELNSTGWVSTDTFDMTGLLIENTGALRPYFDVNFSSPSYLTITWAGTAYASSSIATGNLAVSKSPSVWTTATAATATIFKGANSMYIQPNGASNDTAAQWSGLTVSGGLVAGKTYTIRAKVNIVSPQVGSLHARARSIYLYDNVSGFGGSPFVSAPNTVGTHTVTLTATIPLGATDVRLRLYHGGANVNDQPPLSWSELVIVEGVYDGPFFMDSAMDLSVTPDVVTGWVGVSDESSSFMYTPFEVYGAPIMSAGGGDFWLEDSERGRFTGFLESASRSEAGMTYSALSNLGKLNVNGTVPPAQFSYLGNYILSVFEAAGAVGFTLDIDPDIARRERDFVGYSGNLWVGLNQLLVSEGLEIVSTPSGGALVRIPRQISLDHAEDINFSDSAGVGTGASKYVDVEWRKVLPYVFRPEVYPVKGQEREAQVISVEAGETISVDLQLDCSVLSVNQPTCVSWVESDIDYYQGTSGVYSVAGSDGKGITPEFWLEQGGSLRVETTDDPTIIRVIVRGCDNDSYAPYRIAMTSGEFYNSLRITGSAVMFVRQTTRIPTGADPRLVESPEPLLVSNPYIRDLGTAIRTGAYAAEANSGRSRSLSLTTRHVDRDFGNVVGARIEGDGLFWRVVNSVSSESQTVISAVADSTNTDLESVWAGETAADFESAWEGYTLREFAIQPLRRIA